MSAVPVAPVQSILQTALAPLVQTSSVVPAGAPSFGRLLMNGIDNVNRKLTDADTMVRAFTLDDSIPVHQVTYALDQARASMELALQVRARLLDGYQQLMNMQL